TYFHKLLFDISEALTTTELDALKFLSLDYIPVSKLEGIQRPQDFFKVLQEKNMMEAGNLSYLKELLFYISRIDLLETRLGSSREEMERELQVPGRAKVSAYRQLLYRIAEDLAPEDVKDVKFLLQEQIPRNKLQDNAAMLDVFIEMEKKGILGEDNLSKLKTLCANINISLLKRIEEYELKFAGSEPCCATCKGRGAPGGQCSFTNCLSSQQLEVYKMTSRPRGVCLILNNHDFAKAREAVPELRHMKDRNGTDVDAAALRRVFSKLHFTIAEYKDLTAEEIRKTVNIYKCEDHKDKDCFVCCILSHGKKGIIYGVDGQEVPIQELTTSFTGRNCRSLAGKPKVFFVQACQGEACQKGVTIETDSGKQDSSIETDARFQLDCIPTEADFLLGMATLQDYVSYRSTRQGTWYIQALCQHLEYSCPRGEDILTILTAVNREVSRKTCMPNAEKQMPQPSFTLRKKLIFPVN
ncbi:CASP8 protein, partial [Ceuthmochares aereus]|nr:CASP8 protein [Ceuthmochares aereus]